MKITDILSPSSVRLKVEGKDKNTILEQLVDVLNDTGKVKDRDGLLKVIMDREKLMSTGIGQGVALPHGKTNIVDESIAALATLTEPIAFDSLDDKPVNIILMLVGTENNVGAHLRLLSRISRMVGSEQFRNSLASAGSVDDVMDMLSSYEEERS